MRSLSANNPVLLVTLGQRPEAITVALDALLDKYTYDEIGILTTDPKNSGIRRAYHALHTVLADDYQQYKFTVDDYILCHPDGSPIIDLDTNYSAEAYFRGLLQVMKPIREQATPIHLLIAGGRKAMSVYAMLAATWLFGVNDRVLTVLTPQELMQSGFYHMPSKHAHSVQVVEMPMVISRELPITLAAKDIDEMIATQSDPARRFIESLSHARKRVANALAQEDGISNVELASQLGIVEKTVENHLNDIYKQLAAYFDIDHLSDAQKRQMLIDVMRGRV
ncbi:hypothetical protein G4Y79_14560 [Phototrophicus methaneseepsis]|uniref:Uncharacterized protein n=1 Tax=Phototrophicus methaneseepsis TaxID=2710758 RepID=A0A7S8E5T7_9CHLR|nr:CRISPR-associated ring nuclease [Phototrophicus methaneseepsis]QPC80928.1 hypothetical protein G4Y79_14560 [Phototrophicus methaneseepsis]